jgi:hypothetical protein
VIQGILENNVYQPSLLLGSETSEIDKRETGRYINLRKAIIPLHDRVSDRGVLSRFTNESID